MKRSLAMILLIVAATVLLMVQTACSSGGSDEVDIDISINLSADNSLFDKDSVTVPAGARVAVVLDNKESVLHNFALYNSPARTASYFIGEYISKGKITYVFTAPSSPGTYFFRCDLHPITMTGDFIVT